MGRELCTCMLFNAYAIRDLLCSYYDNEICTATAMPQEVRCITSSPAWVEI